MEGETEAEGAAPPATEAAPAEAPAAPSPPLKAKDLAEAQAQEIRELLGPDVRTPAGIPRDYRPSDMSLEPLLRVEVGDFAGPLDLLLYLIRKHDLDIFDIPIKFVTDQYLKLLEDMRALEIDIAAEFLVLAAELTHIKSKMLLPVQEGVALEEDPKDEGDPRAELVRRLLEYQKYRDAADQLADRDQLGRDVFGRNPGRIDEDGELDPGMKSISIFKLVELMARIMKRTSLHHEISFESFSITERIQHIMAFADAREGRFTLVQLLEGMLSRSELVVTFIGVLEMTKLGLIRIKVEGPIEPEGPTLFERRLQPLEAPEPEAPIEGSLEDLESIEAEEREMPAWARPEARQDMASAIQSAEVAPEKAPAAPEEPLPTIWVELTGKRFEGELLDDYR